ncbi:MAG: hypothetical protein H0U73_13595 [Tatlockia sp.]|nr:hypothetical protein [Tatlockia sp.]
MEFLNKLLTFFFINSKINLYIDFDEWHEEKQQMLDDEAIAAKSIYKKQIRRYFGFGFFLSFFPGTEPFLARMTLFSIMTRVDDDFFKSNILSILAHLFHRTFESIVHSVIDSSAVGLLQIIFREKQRWGANRLNPFLYLTKLLTPIVIIISFIFDRIISSLSHSKEIILHIILSSVYLVLAVATFIYFALYFITEILLNSLHTLLVEPSIFAYEVITQLITNWSLQFTYTATDEFYKINNLKEALEAENTSDIVETCKPKVYKTMEFTLVESTEKQISSYKKHRDSYFFKAFKDSDLFQQKKEIIVEKHQRLESLNTFYLFASRTFPQLDYKYFPLFPKDVIRIINYFCLALSWQQLQAPIQSINVEEDTLNRSDNFLI